MSMGNQTEIIGKFNYNLKLNTTTGLAPLPLPRLILYNTGISI